MGTIVICIGNPVLTDDSVGLKVASAVRERLQGRTAAAAAELHSGGLRLMETMAGYDRAILIDAIVTGGSPGTIYALDLDDLPNTRNAHSTHDGTLAVALELGRLAGPELPGEIRIWAVEAGDVESFGEGLTSAVEQAVPRVVDYVMRQLGEQEPGESRRSGE